MSQKLLTWPEAAAKLDGWLEEGASDEERAAAGRRLRWAVMGREKQTKKRIATRLGARGDREPKTRITMGALFRHLPELKRSNADQLSAAFKAYIDEIDEQIAEAAAGEIERLVQPQVSELHEKGDKAQETADVANANASRALQRINELEQQLKRLLRSKTNKPELARTDDEKP